MKKDILKCIECGRKMLVKKKIMVCSRGCESVYKNKIANQKWIEKPKETKPRAITHPKFARSHLSSTPAWLSKFNVYRG